MKFFYCPPYPDGYQCPKCGDSHDGDDPCPNAPPPHQIYPDEEYDI